MRRPFTGIEDDHAKALRLPQGRIQTRSSDKVSLPLLVLEDDEALAFFVHPGVADEVEDRRPLQPVAQEREGRMLAELQLEVAFPNEGGQGLPQDPDLLLNFQTLTALGARGNDQEANRSLQPGIFRGVVGGNVTNDGDMLGLRQEDSFPVAEEFPRPARYVGAGGGDVKAKMLTRFLRLLLPHHPGPKDLVGENGIEESSSQSSRPVLRQGWGANREGWLWRRTPGFEIGMQVRRVDLSEEGDLPLGVHSPNRQPASTWLDEQLEVLTVRGSGEGAQPALAGAGKRPSSWRRMSPHDKFKRH